LVSIVYVHKCTNKILKAISLWLLFTLFSDFSRVDKLLNCGFYLGMITAGCDEGIVFLLDSW